MQKFVDSEGHRGVTYFTKLQQIRSLVYQFAALHLNAYSIEIYLFSGGLAATLMNAATLSKLRCFSLNGKVLPGYRSKKRDSFRFVVAARVVKANSSTIVRDDSSVASQIIGTDEQSGKVVLSEVQEALEETLKKKSLLGHSTSDLQSNNVHRLWVGLGASAILGMFVKSALAVQSGDSATATILSGLAAYILADLGTGIYHWGVDNYGDASTPVFGSQIDAFQGHHQRPWTITKREFANNLHALCRPTFFFLLPFLFTPNMASLDAFLGVFLSCVVLSQQFHAWSHTRKNNLPPLVIKLQDLGLLVGRRMHGAHHRPPYNTNYCIVSGICNKFLDESKFFPWMESQIFKIYGVAPRSWGETAPEWLEIQYYEDEINQS